MVALGTGAYTYEVIENWAKLPAGWSFKEVGGVGTDAQDNVYVFNRGAHPMMVFDRHGNFLRAWGEGLFPRAHGITMGPDNTVFCTDDGDHTVRKCTLDGKVLLTLGTSGKPAPFMSGEPFIAALTWPSIPATGIFMWQMAMATPGAQVFPGRQTPLVLGRLGTDPGQFNIVHNIATDRDGWVYVADRENHRIQVFDPHGRFETQWVNMARPCGLYIDQAAALAYIGELGVAIGPTSWRAAWGHASAFMTRTGRSWRVSVISPQGRALASSLHPTACALTREAIFTLARSPGPTPAVTRATARNPFLAETRPPGRVTARPQVMVMMARPTMSPRFSVA